MKIFDLTPPKTFQTPSEGRKGGSPYFSGRTSRRDTVLFGAADKPTDAKGPEAPSAGTDVKDVKTVKTVKPEQVTFTENSFAALKSFQTRVMVEPAIAWPLTLMEELLREPSVKEYVENKCNVKRFDLLWGINRHSLPLITKAYGEKKSLLPEAFYQKTITPGIRQYVAEEGRTEVTPLDIWQWLLKKDPSGKLDTLLKGAMFDSTDVQGVKVGPFDEAAIERLKSTPTVPVVVQEETEKPRTPTKEEVLKIMNAVKNVTTDVIGQDKAIEKVLQAIWVARVGYRYNKDKPNQPKVRLLLMGPAGVGKTFTSKKIAKVLGRPIVYVPLSQYTSEMSSSNVVGAAQGYKDSDKMNFVREIKEAVERAKREGTPGPLIIFDELEKAHEDIRRNIMQALDEGVMYTNDRQPVYFKDCDIMMTSNIAQREITQAYEDGKTYEEIEAIAETELNKEIAPDFKSRLSDIVIFEPLSPEAARTIMEGQLKELQAASKERDGYDLSIHASLKDEIFKQGYKRDTGVRTMENSINSLLHSALLKKIAQLIVDDQPLQNAKIRAKWQKGKVVLDYKAPEAPPVAQLSEAVTPTPTPSPTSAPAPASAPTPENSPTTSLPAAAPVSGVPAIITEPAVAFPVVQPDAAIDAPAPSEPTATPAPAPVEPVDKIPPEEGPSLS